MKIKWMVVALVLVSGCQQQRPVTGSLTLRLYLGQQYLALKEYVNAERNFRKVVDFYPDDFRGWWGLAEVAVGQGATEQAAIYYAQAFRKAPENARLINNYGAFLCALGQYDKAIRLIERKKQSVLLDDRVQVNLQIANCYLHQQNYSRAETELDKIDDQAFSVEPTWLALIHYWKEKQHWQNAELLLMHYHQRFVGNAQTLWLMVLVAAQQGKQDVVDSYGAKLARNFPHSIQYQRYIANEY